MPGRVKTGVIARVMAGGSSPLRDTCRVPPRHDRRPASPLSAVIQGIGELLLTLGVVMLLFVGYELVWTDQETHRTQRDLERQFQRTATEPQRGDPIAVVRMPRLGKEWKFVVVQGVGTKELKRGPGHLPETALPGDVGNFAVAGHRVTYAHPFHDLGKVRAGDKIYVSTRDARFTYTVTEKLVVLPGETEVAAPVPGDPDATPTARMLTFITCNPKYSARERLVVHAKLTSAPGGS